jgi:putative peptide zinc metalloprotease protein
MPMRTVSEGVVWLPEDAWIRADSDGFAQAPLVESGALVRAGEPVVLLENEVLEADVSLYTAQLREARIRHQAELAANYARSQLTAEAVSFLEERLARAEEQKRALTIRSPAQGRVIFSDEAGLPGRYFTRGEAIGWVVQPDALRGRVVVDSGAVDLVRRRTRGVSIRFSERVGSVLPARLVREIPAASRDLPSAALGTQGGGELALDPAARESTRAFERVFQFELALAAPEKFRGFGQRIHVRFEHGAAPLAYQWYRMLRQLFLARLHV